MRFTLRGARLVDASTDLPEGNITVEDGRIVAMGATAEAAGDVQGEVLDARDMIVAPGFLDVHTHGGGGFNLHTTSPDEILAYARWAPASGVTSFLIGVVGTPGDVPEPQLRTAVSAIGAWRDGAEPLGIHLEGPYLSLARRGAHLPAWLRLPNPAETERVLALADGRLRLMTLAPELPGAHELIRRLVEAGVTASIGHTDATYEQAQVAIALGVSHATHCCNAMPPLRHRDPGPLAAIAESPHVLGEVIADGIHVHPAMMQVLLKMLGTARTIVITDAQAAAGIGDADFVFGGQPAHVVNGAAWLADGTLTGSVLTMDLALRNAVALPGVALPAAVGMLTHNPARSAHVDDRKGQLAAGFDADLVVLDNALRVHATFCRGALAFGAEPWRERIAALAALDEARVAD
ncbi:MAG: N-acetylglucosamine-6-phosphate deacetylase [Ktedonobacterales bacterium]